MFSFRRARGASGQRSAAHPPLLRLCLTGNIQRFLWTDLDNSQRCETFALLGACFSCMNRLDRKHVASVGRSTAGSICSTFLRKGNWVSLADTECDREISRKVPVDWASSFGLGDSVFLERYGFSSSFHEDHARVFCS